MARTNEPKNDQAEAKKGPDYNIYQVRNAPDEATAIRSKGLHRRCGLGQRIARSLQCRGSACLRRLGSSPRSRRTGL